MILGRNERAFILGSLFYRELPLACLRGLAADGLKWHQLAAAARRLGLGPLVANAVIEAGLHDLVPRSVAERLLGDLHHNTAQNAAVLVLLARAIGALTFAGIRALPIKGAALLLEDEALVPLRHLDDIDLLVQPGDVNRAVEVLRSVGWRIGAESMTVSGGPASSPVGRGRVHNAFELRGPTDLVLELHHALPSTGGSPRAAGAEYFGRARSLSWRLQPIACPSQEDLLALACEHVLVHHREELVHIPRLVLDLHALVSAGTSPAKAMELWGGNLKDVVRSGLALLEEARVSTVTPTRVGRRRAERPLSLLWIATNELHLVALKVARAPRLFLEAVRTHGWRTVFPAPAYMASKYGVSERSLLLPALYVWRPIKGAFRMIIRR
jgi:hypothetical protein